ncbi:type II secretion system inner membrane protein GspF [Chitinimonas taiwanensis]|jgi:general secretion pathway protein F|uniref:General secretion pathway protein F n=1 Tax=Chitinimonas taiwanensis DSM 18899 TaxID=1121279 RepID=A0A1K2HQE0_9NEIS|nr:type II secretion system inner membrane protein GspF [Chitinimonas taiwanensis]SFZ78974.1 general secretion pathway protein F [Chitinimonas taiwanensis DSM 18899]
MAGFRYQCLDAAGKQADGVVEADNARLARAKLREQGLWVLDMQELAEGDAQGKRSRSGGVSTAELALITRQFATLLDAGLTIERALTVLIEQAENLRLRDVLAGVRSEVLAGSAMSVALARHPRVFPELYRTIVRAGEESGKAAGVMARLADYIEARQALSAKVALAFVYPAVVLSVSLLVIVGMLWWVVPQMVGVFQSSKQELPLLTRALLAISAGIREYGLIGFIVLGLAGAGFARALKNPAFRLRLDAWLLRLPLFGRLNKASNTARLASTLSILVGSGVPLLKAMEAAAGVVENLVLRGAVSNAARDVREGAPLSKALDRQKLFPPVLVHLIASGEASGRLEDMLDKAARQQAGELEQRVATFTSLLGPVMVLLMGVAVLLIVLAILLPVFEMNQLVK